MSQAQWNHGRKTGQKEGAAVAVAAVAAVVAIGAGVKWLIDKAKKK